MLLTHCKRRLTELPKVTVKNSDARLSQNNGPSSAVRSHLPWPEHTQGQEWSDSFRVSRLCSPVFKDVWYFRVSPQFHWPFTFARVLLFLLARLLMSYGAREACSLSFFPQAVKLA